MLSVNITVAKYLVYRGSVLDGAGHSGMCLWSQLLRRLKQENILGPGVQDQSGLHSKTMLE